MRCIFAQILLIPLCALVAAESTGCQPEPQSETPAERVPGPVSASVEPAPARYFAIEVVDDLTHRGVPLVELTTVSNVRYWTDSNGLVALDDPALIGHRIFFTVRSDGYENPADGFGYHGRAVEVTAGGHAVFKIHRLNIAERLYRVTGEGIYHDSVLLERPVPIKHPLINAEVVGQDSVHAVVYHGKLYWFFGDTMRQSYPLGQFWTSGAISDFPENGGVDPDLGVDLTYFTAKDGFSRPMFEHVGGNVKWLDGVVVIRDDKGREHMIGRCDLRKGLTDLVGRTVVLFNDESERFDTLADVPIDAPLYPRGHPFVHEENGKRYCYFCDPFPNTRVLADLESIKDLKVYESFTPLVTGSRAKKDDLRLDRGATGELNWAWKRDTAPLSYEQEAALIRAGKLTVDEARFCPLDVETRKPVYLGIGSVCYNEYRHRWVMIATQRGGHSSFLGEVWYSEADRPEGPWLHARHIVTHDHYSFYNPTQHPFFDRDGGRIIYFEGTYVGTFSRESDLTPRYDYNQIMYKLDLSDPRLDFSKTASTTRPAGR